MIIKLIFNLLGYQKHVVVYYLSGFKESSTSFISGVPGGLIKATQKLNIEISIGVFIVVVSLGIRPSALIFAHSLVWVSVEGVSVEKISPSLGVLNFEHIFLFHCKLFENMNCIGVGNESLH